MSIRREEFTVGDQAALAIRLASGRVRIDEGPAGTVTISVDGSDADSFTVEQVGGRIVVEQPSGAGRWGSHQVAVTAPPGVSVEARLASADLDAAAPLSGLRVEAASGGVRAHDVDGDVRVKAASGDVQVRDVTGEIEITTASGDIRAGEVAGLVELNTASGACAVTAAAGPLSARTASGTIAVNRYDGADLQVRSISGDVRIGFPTGRTLDVDLSSLSGRVHNRFDLDDGAGGGTGDATGHARVRVRTVSGDITIGPAAG